MNVSRFKKIGRVLWDILYIGIISLNSFIILFLRNKNNSKLVYVICAAALAYVITIFMELVIFSRDASLRSRLQFTRKVFRLIYTAIYLTIIMIDLIRITDAGTDRFKYPANSVIYEVIMFNVVAITGSSCMWMKKLIDALKKEIFNYFEMRLQVKVLVGIQKSFAKLVCICNIAGINDLNYPLEATDDDR